VRRGEIGTSAAFIRAALDGLRKGTPAEAGGHGTEPGSPSVFRGWRGEIVHISLTNEGKVQELRIVDPSFRTGPGSRSPARQEISDFPLCNKSFNLHTADTIYRGPIHAVSVLARVHQGTGP
jgi:Ni,Fe-hydrogenase III large subunit